MIGVKNVGIIVVNIAILYIIPYNNILNLKCIKYNNYNNKFNEIIILNKSIYILICIY
jgi:hypothetical protein